MAVVVWTDRAVVQFQHIVEYIASYDDRAASRMARRLIETSEGLRDFPHRGRPVRGDYRELPTIRPYIILYQVEGDTVSILDIRHGAQAPRDR